MLRTLAYIVSYGGLFALWKLTSAEWMLAAVALGTCYQFYHRIRYGHFVDFED